MKTFEKVALFVSSLVMAAPAFAASTATINLSGTVASQTFLSTGRTDGDVTNFTKSLDVSSILLTGGTATLADKIYEVSNASAGYTITITSANSGKLQAAGVGTNVGYSLNYAAEGRAVKTCDFSSACTVSTGALSGKVNKEVTISATSVGNANLLAGIYKDTVTISIATP